MIEDMERYVLEHFDDALENGYFQPYYQPVVRTITRQVCSFEALARWVDPDHGVIPPVQFIPILEQNRRIHELDACIIRQVCARIRSTLSGDGIAVPVSVNLSRRDFALCDIFSVVDEAVQYYKIPRDYLHIEITESTMAQQAERMQEVIRRFRSAGYQVWMDDFGSAYSSLNVLKDFTFDELKLDMRFLSSFDHRSRCILGSVIQMAKEIEVHTLAEGVETEEQYLYLRDIGCEKAQGYFFGRPLPYSDALRHLQETGMGFERPQDRVYYDEVGLVNFLSAVPFLTRSDRGLITSARELNSIPLTMAEVRGERFRILFCNAAFERMAEAARLSDELFHPEHLLADRPISILPVRVVDLMEASRSGEEAQMFFISNEEYYEVRAKCIAQTRERYCVLFRMSNLSKEGESKKTLRLDEGLRQIYAMFDRITLLDLKQDCITPLYMATREDLTSSRSGLEQMRHEFAERWIFPEDREAYLRFTDCTTFDCRLRESGRSAISQSFRSYQRNGEYIWKQYTILPYREDCYVELIRNVHQEVVDFLDSRAGHLSTQKFGFPPELLWDNLLRSGTLRLFWKDRNRRFLGVSQSFLDYYGFPDEQTVLGKTDEDLGWHVHPGHYMNVEERVIHEGMVTRHVPGQCIRQGENREIFASKLPLYDANGEIRGLLGFFLDRKLLLQSTEGGRGDSLLDLLTGLLNTRGIYEQAQAFQDEYFLRNVDFIRLHIAIDDFTSINRQYGFDFGDRAISALGAALQKGFGRSAAVGRYNGYQFVVLRQIRSPEDARVLREQAQMLAAELREIDGVPLTIYLSVGYSLFSESEDLDEQSRKAEACLMVDHDERSSIENRLQRASEVFRIYDDLPISYVVYRVIQDENAAVQDAVIFYVNHKFEERSGCHAAELLGHRTRELYPTLTEDWYKKAGRAALRGETIVDRFYFEPTGKTYYMTASQIVRPGYCCFTYQEMDLLDHGED